ncbi:MAG: maleylpyruvate isomerase N-terminal domain-containing protein, partial [Chloroflexi bacterium]|nr:maleylpyruvate isomerase N-terminal domain-containing protein [Chloroflexota bacterium]
MNSLPLEALERPSPCEMWDVGEVIAHLEWF